MSAMWGIHNNRPELGLVDGEFVSVGWDRLGDLQLIGDDKEAMKARIASAYPEAKAGAIPVWAGVLLRFAFEMKQGDVVVYPHKPDSTLNLGEVAGDYYFDGSAEIHQHRRAVKWLATDVPRAEFSQAARYEIGSAVTMFRVRTNEKEFRSSLAGDHSPTPIPAVPGDDSVEEAVDTAAQAVTAERIEQDTKDFIIEKLMKDLEGPEFEHFVADLLRAMGYRAQVTQVSGDGGVDVIAHRDPLGLEPPVIKVQCKRTQSKMGAPEVQKLTGTLAPGGAELGLFVTLGAFSPDAKHLGRSRHDLRLVSGEELVNLVFEHYEVLDPRWKRLIPMRSVYVVDEHPEAG